MGKGLGDGFAWDDLEKFLEISKGLKKGETLEKLGARLGLESPRMVKLRLDRLEKSLNLSQKGLVARRQYERDARLTEEGARLLEYAERLAAMRGEIQALFDGQPLPTLRMTTNLPSLFILAPEVVKGLIERRRRDGHPPDLGFRPDLFPTEDYAEAMTSVAQGEFDVALFARSPTDRVSVLPKNLEVEVILSSEVSVLVTAHNKLFHQHSSNLSINELVTEHIVARPLYRYLFPTAGPKGGWTPVIHSGDVHAYIRSGIGVGLNTHFGFHMLREFEQKLNVSNMEDILEIPLKHPKKVDYCLIRPKSERRWRNVGKEAEAFLAALRTYYQQKRKEVLRLCQTVSAIDV